MHRRLSYEAGRYGLTGLEISADPSSGGTAIQHCCSVIAELTPTCWMYIDVMMLLAAVLLTRWLTLGAAAGAFWSVQLAASTLAFPIAVIMAGTICGLYEQQTFRSRSRIAVRSLASYAIGTTLGCAVIGLLPNQHVEPGLPAAIGLFSFAVGASMRIVAHQAAAITPVRVLFLGHGPSIATMIELMLERPNRHYDLRGYLLTERRGEVVRLARRLPILGTIDSIVSVVREERIDEVVVDAALVQDQRVGQAIVDCLHERCRVTDQPTFHERLLGSVPVADITSQWYLVSNIQTSSGYSLVKRSLDLVVALFGLLVTLPLWPVIALAIRAESRGSALYRQNRVGMHGQTFSMLKFRTMRLDAERNGPRWASKNDSRVTRIGRFLRRTRLDELPQLINVLRGEMSLVGPRPERPEFVEKLASQIPHYHQRHLIRPGVTGWAQIKCGYGASVEDARRKLCYDFFYLKHRSIDMDVAILLRTVRKFMDGAC
ncbi:MAG: sugar transferase [Planctomycetes bacterium]|nr:sugar transferase [Planctomycetota bacterium]